MFENVEDLINLHKGIFTDKSWIFCISDDWDVLQIYDPCKIQPIFVPSALSSLRSSSLSLMILCTYELLSKSTILNLLSCLRHSPRFARVRYRSRAQVSPFGLHFRLSYGIVMGVRIYWIETHGVWRSLSLHSELCGFLEKFFNQILTKLSSFLVLNPTDYICLP